MLHLQFEKYFKKNNELNLDSEDMKVEEMVTGKIYNNGKFNGEFQLEKVTQECAYHELVFIGNEDDIHFTCGYKKCIGDDEGKLPNYTIEIKNRYDFIEIFYMDSLSNVNEFLREMKPLTDIIKNQEKRTGFK
jgi:hypothetical protein